MEPYLGEMYSFISYFRYGLERQLSEVRTQKLVKICIHMYINYKFKNTKYIKNVEVHHTILSLSTPDLHTASLID